VSQRKGESREEYLARVRAYQARRREDPSYRQRCREEQRAYRRDPDGRERIREHHQQPEVKERYAAHARKFRHDRRIDELEALGNPTTCGVCGKDLTPVEGQRDPRCVDHRHDNEVIRGVVCSRCNGALGYIDLRYTAPELWAKLLAWSAKGEPAMPTGRKRTRTRRLPEPPLTLFPEGK
jgi:hypothetical protein